jgi:hypothetical protein
MKTKCNVFHEIIQNITTRVIIPIPEMNYRQIPGYSSRGVAIGVISDISPLLLIEATDLSLFLSRENTEIVSPWRLRSTF